MKKALVAYFSASGVTADVAIRLRKLIGADLFEIRPLVPYSKEDLDWRNAASRSSLEMKDPSSRPAIADTCGNASDYDVIFVGFPIWWYVAPTIVNAFLESCDLKGKTIVPFATSGGSGMGDTCEKLRVSCPGAKLKNGKRMNGLTDEEIRIWAEHEIREA